MKLFIDVDSTLVKSRKRLCEYYAHKYSVNVNWQDVKEWNLTDVLELANRGEVGEWFNHRDFYAGIEFYSNAKKYINKLSKIYKIHFCTVGSVKNLNHKSLFLRENFPNIPIISLSENISKGLVNMSDSIFLDDKMQNLEESNANSKILFQGNGIQMNYNKEWKDSIVENWKEVYNLLEGGVKLNG